jgi:hypothetical protein
VLPLHSAEGYMPYRQLINCELSQKRGNTLNIATIHPKIGTRHVGCNRTHHTVDKGYTVRWVGRGRVGTRRIKLECVKSGAMGECGFIIWDRIDSRARAAPQISLQKQSEYIEQIDEITNQDEPRCIGCCSRPIQIVKRTTGVPFSLEAHLPQPSDF